MLEGSKAENYQSMGTAEKPQIQPVCGKLAACFEMESALPKYSPSLTGRCSIPRQHVQINVKVVPPSQMYR